MSSWEHIQCSCTMKISIRPTLLALGFCLVLHNLPRGKSKLRLTKIYKRTNIFTNITHVDTHMNLFISLHHLKNFLDIFSTRFWAILVLLKICTDFSLILGTLQKCNFRTESKKLSFYIDHVKAHYSSVTNKSTGPNKRTGWTFDKNQISVQGGILIKIVECRVKTGNFINNKRDF